MLFTLEVKTHVNTGRPTVVTDLGEEIDVKQFIAAVWKQDPRIVAAAMYEGEGLTPKTGETIQ